MTTNPSDRQYTSNHEWVLSAESKTVRVGITAYAAEQLGDIVYVSLPAVGQQVTAEESCGELESTKSVSDVYAPLSGVVTAVNEAVAADPAAISADPFGAGWLFELSAEGSVDSLLDAEAYSALTN